MNPILSNASPPGTPVIIKPTVGQVVWVRCCPLMFIATDGGPVNRWDESQPFRADIDFVISDRQINVSGNDHVGRPFVIPHCTLVQEGDAIPPSGPYAQWMPYQQGQARAQAVAVVPEVVRSTPQRDDVGQVALAEQASVVKSPAQKAAESL